MFSSDALSFRNGQLWTHRLIGGPSRKTVCTQPAGGHNLAYWLLVLSVSLHSLSGDPQQLAQLREVFQRLTEGERERERVKENEHHPELADVQEVRKGYYSVLEVAGDSVESPHVPFHHLGLQSHT